MIRREETTINDLIREAGWFKGTERDWKALPLAERDRLAFAATGCAVAYATWKAPVDCCHTGCKIMRGELPKIAETNGILRDEGESGWLRFLDREAKAKTYRAVRKAARMSGVYNPWKMPGGWQAIVFSGVQAL